MLSREIIKLQGCMEKKESVSSTLNRWISHNNNEIDKVIKAMKVKKRPAQLRVTAVMFVVSS